MSYTQQVLRTTLILGIILFNLIWTNAVRADTPDGAINGFFTARNHLAKSYRCIDDLDVVCLPMRPGFKGDLLVDGNPIDYAPCNNREVSIYDFAASVPTSDRGPFEILWNVGRGTYRDRLSTLDSLTYFFRNSDVRGGWYRNRDGKLISDFSERYKNVQLISADSRQTYTITMHREELADGTEVTLADGTYLLTATDGNTTSELVLTVECAEPIDRYVSAIQGVKGKFCFPFTGKPGDHTFEYLEQTGKTLLTPDKITESCAHFDAEIAGISTTLVNICNKKSTNCDVVLVTIEVFEKTNLKPPTVNNETFGVAYNGQRILTVIQNDEIIGEITSMTLNDVLTRGEARVDQQNRIHYSAPENFAGEDQIEYEVCSAGGCGTGTIRVEITSERLVVFNGFSPNSDQKNDHFTILGIENFANNEVLIFDQEGMEVFQASEYENDWDGTFQGVPLPDGTYYYLVNIPNEDPRSGYVQIRR